MWRRQNENYWPVSNLSFLHRSMVRKHQILLNLHAVSATAFATVNPLTSWLGVSGKAIDWLKSYLTGRCHKANLGDCLSSKFDLPFGVPHMSVLSLLLFPYYTTPLGCVISGPAIRKKKPESFLIRNEWQSRKYLSRFPVELFRCQNKPHKIRSESWRNFS